MGNEKVEELKGDGSEGVRAFARNELAISPWEAWLPFFSGWSLVTRHLLFITRHSSLVTVSLTAQTNLHYLADQVPSIQNADRPVVSPHGRAQCASRSLAESGTAQ